MGRGQFMAVSPKKNTTATRKSTRRASTARARRRGMAKGTTQVSEAEDEMAALDRADAEDRQERDIAPSLDDLKTDAAAIAPVPAKSKKASKTEERASFLSMYFRDMSALGVLKPEEEFAAAKEIEELEIEIWYSVLSLPAAVEYALKLVDNCFEDSIPEVREVRRLAKKARTSTTKSATKKLDDAIRLAAASLRAVDTDRKHLDSIIADLNRLQRKVPTRLPGGEVDFSTDDKKFDAYMARIANADKEAAVARNKFVKANLRLVVSIARRFNHGRMALSDLIQEGNIGLMKAVERYDYHRGFRFSTYASWWIRHAISRSLADKGREVRLPVHMIDAYHKLAKGKRELTGKLGRQPTVVELGELTGIPPAKVEKMRTYLVDQSLSLDRPVNDEDGRKFMDFLQDPNSRDNNPVDKLTTETLAKEVRGLLKDLKPIEAEILSQRFGLDDDVELTLKEIGKKYNLSRERIRQLQEQALGKMRRALARKQML